MAGGTVAVSIPTNLVREAFARMGKDFDVASMVASVIEDFLERTRGDGAVWSREHADEVSREEPAGEHHGDPSKGYQWTTVFLPNGTKVRMTYKGADSYGIVEHQRLVLDGKARSPSQFARAVALGTARNAWRDLWLQFPGSRDWQLADTVRLNRA